MNFNVLEFNEYTDINQMFAIKTTTCVSRNKNIACP